MRKLVLSAVLFASAITVHAQKSEIAEAKKIWGLFQLSVSLGNAGGNANKVVTDPKLAAAAINSQSASSRMPTRGVSKYGNVEVGVTPTAEKRKIKSLSDQLSSLNEGLAHVDKAVANEKTKDLPETWSYRALFTSAIAFMDTVDVQNADRKLKDAETAIAKAKSLDVKGEEKANIESAEENVLNAIRNKGLRAYTAKDYQAALTSFNELLAINPQDTLMYMNAGITAKTLGNYPEAIKNFRKVISFNVPEQKGYFSEIITMDLVNLKDTTAALSVIDEALAKYPTDEYFLGINTDVYNQRGDVEKSQASLKRLIEINPNKAIYHHLYGDTYYRRALSLQEAKRKIDPKNAKEIDATTAKITALIDQSLPYYKEAVKIDPKYVPSLETLKQIYAFKGDNENFNDVKNKLATLSGVKTNN
ncbi:MAG: tetratricopeptide repeat protein [Pedobacter sp.]|nr:tetratricopeptide repeat protein [Pedobacter sp.]MDQ8052015.1 tetratricopeptide repeat protein [Pedobacter sp.]